MALARPPRFRHHARRWRTASIFAVVALVGASCGGLGVPERAVEPEPASERAVAPSDDLDGSARTVEQVPGDPREDVPSALESIIHPDLPEPLVEERDLRAGGPPPDGIPPIDDPAFLPAEEVEWLAAGEPVIAVELGGEARAYPVQVLIWHEIVNDTVGGIPVTVSYCPLCNSAIVYDRRLGERLLDFGTSGLLYRSALVMYDRQTRSLWSHFSAGAVAGALTDSTLEVHPSSTVAWEEWREANPDGLVLSRRTGHRRDYGANPYPGYDSLDSPPMFSSGSDDERLVAKERVVGLGMDSGDPVAVRTDRLAELGVVSTDVDGSEVIVWSLPGTASALEEFEVAEGRDVGATGAFLAELDGAALEFRRIQGGFTDAGTGSTWNVLGEATDGPLAGRRLQPVRHVDTFWFAWSAFAPESRILP